MIFLFVYRYVFRMNTLFFIERRKMCAKRFQCLSTNCHPGSNRPGQFQYNGVLPSFSDIIFFWKRKFPYVTKFTHKFHMEVLVFFSFYFSNKQDFVFSVTNSANTKSSIKMSCDPPFSNALLCSLNKPSVLVLDASWTHMHSSLLRLEDG